MAGRSSSNLLLFFLFSAATVFSVSSSLRFDLQTGHTKCISEDIKVAAMSVGKYFIVNPSSSNSDNDASVPLLGNHNITVRVTSPHGNSLHFGDSVDSGNFAFTASEVGDYLACFWTPDHKPGLTLTVEFEWRIGIAAKDWTNVAKKGQIDVYTKITHGAFMQCRQPGAPVSLGGQFDNIDEQMELELKKLEDTVTSIHEEMFYLREREVEMQDMNRATNSRMAWFSFLSIAVCLSVAALQLWHLKTYFERKKLL